jgi:DNA helicase-2/ATP-dependent DNA helicase PcrA
VVSETEFQDKLQKFIDLSGYYKYLSGNDNTPERTQNIEELIAHIKKYQIANPTKTLRDFLNEVSIYSTKENDKNDGDKVSLMTIHFSKGAEYKVVFVIGLNEGIFPALRTSHFEEERRIAYVALTRAKEKLFLTNRRGYDYRSQTQLIKSRFIDEIGAHNFVKEERKMKPISKFDIA